MNVNRAFKITMDKASDVAKDIFKDKKKLKKLQQKLAETVRSDWFQTYKILFETGAAVGGVIMVIEYYLDPPAKAGEVNDKIDELFEKLKNEITNQGLKSEELEVETVQENDLMERIKELEKRDEENKRTIEKNKQNFKALKDVAILTVAVMIFFAITPIKAIELIEESIK